MFWKAFRLAMGLVLGFAVAVFLVMSCVAIMASAG